MSRYIFMSILPMAAMLSLMATEARSQEMVVAFKSGDTVRHALSGIMSIRFEAEQMVIREYDGTSTVWAIADIEKYGFDEMTGLRDEGRESLRLELYPNPTRADLTVGLVLRKGGEVAIDILDAAGRVVGEVYRGPHQGSAEYRWDGGGEGMPVAGVYHCRVRTASGTVTKPFIKQ